MPIMLILICVICAICGSFCPAGLYDGNAEDTVEEKIDYDDRHAGNPCTGQPR